MKVLVSDATGLIGSNVVEVLAGLYGDEVIADPVDLLDPDGLAAHVAAHRPEGVVHVAVPDEWSRLLADRQYGWRACIESTRALADAAARADIPFVVVSSDWVFDGTQGPADEQTPPNPVNLCGFLQAAAEIVTLDRGGAVARVSAPFGVNWATGISGPQGEGFASFVGPLVDTLGAGQPFTVWEAGDINMVATPSLASQAAEVIRIMLDEQASGIAHCCGASALTRRELATAAAEAFGLDPGLLHFGKPPRPAALPLPYSTEIDGSITAKQLDLPQLAVGDLLAAYRRERETGAVESFLG